jgi:Rieske 2Fe-2S family protein
MQPLSRAAIEAMVARRQQGMSLEAQFYTSPDMLDVDLKLIFGRHWIFVGSEPEVPEPGDYVTVQIGANSVIVVRDDDGGVRAWHNVCRHRGSRILQDRKGITGNLVCPYHQWTYDLSGKLIHAEIMKECVGAGTHDLKPVALKNMAGLLYVCLSDTPPDDFDSMSAELTPYLAPHRIDRCKVAAQTEIVEQGNWKLTMENNRECYHCGGHPELLCSLFHFFGEYEIPESQREDFARYQATTREMEGIWDESGLPWRAIEKLHGRPTGFRTERLALDGPGESYTMDASRACKKLVGGFTNARLGTLHLHTQPNAWFHFLGDHAVTFSTLPLAADKTLVRTTWLVDRDAVEGEDYDIDNLTAVWRATNEQDGAFVSWAHQGAGSDAYQPGPYAKSEYMCDLFCSWYTERLAAGLATA